MIEPRLPCPDIYDGVVREKPRHDADHSCVEIAVWVRRFDVDLDRTLRALDRSGGMLAFNWNGESFEIPATVTALRVQRMKLRGAPELVYGRDGRPLTIGIEADIEELREAVGTSGKYRLDPINDDGKCVENVPPAYVHGVKVDRVESSALVATVLSSTPAAAAPAADGTRGLQGALHLGA